MLKVAIKTHYEMKKKLLSNLNLEILGNNQSNLIIKNILSYTKPCLVLRIGSNEIYYTFLQMLVERGVIFKIPKKFKHLILGNDSNYCLLNNRINPYDSKNAKCLLGNKYCFIFDNYGEILTGINGDYNSIKFYKA